MRLRRKPWLSAALAQFGEDVFIRQWAGCAGRWRSILAVTGPLRVEVGCGKGRFLAEMATRHPEAGWLGLDAQEGVLYYAAKKIADNGLTNARTVWANAADLPGLFAPGEVDRLYINFCDPWPKRRHAKRRLTHPAFLALYARVLRPGGEMYFKTDNDQLFEFSLNAFCNAGLQLRHISLDLHRPGSDQGDEDVPTEYEEKFLRQGLKIYRCEVIFP